MAKPLKFPIRRMIHLTEFADQLLIKIAQVLGSTPAEQARGYVEEGIKRDQKLINEGTKNEE